MHVIKIDKQVKLFVFCIILGLLACNFLFTQNQRSTYFFYCCILFISTAAMILSKQSTHRDENKGDLFFWVSILILGSIMAFRAQTGIDDQNYRNLFLRVPQFSLFDYCRNSEVEKGYLTLNYILYYLTGGDYNIAQLIIAYIGYFFWGLAILQQKGASRTVDVILIWTHHYFLYMGGGLVRVYIAVAIFFYAIHYIRENEWRKYTLFVIIAFTIHRSALVGLLFLIFRVNKEAIVKHWKKITLGICIFMPVFFILVARCIAPYIGARYSQYRNVGRIGIALGDFDILPVVIVGLYYFRRIDKQYKKDYIIGLILAVLSIAISISSSIVPLGRLSYYANLGILIIIGHICKLKARSHTDIAVVVMLAIYAIFYVMHSGLMVTSHMNNLFPYRTFYGSTF